MAQSKLLYPFVSNAYVFEQHWQFRIIARMWRTEDQDRFSWVSKNYVLAYCHDVLAGIIKYVFHEQALPHEKTNRQM